ncbi:MAG: LuxR family transcriptional regulator [Frankia sp.]|nr:LuxR family transcriptional regulator [Frankia sp.]
MLDLLGLDEVTEAAYLVWLRDETLSAEAVARMLDQPLSVVIRARERLVALSLLVPAPEPGRLRAVHPEAPLERLIQSRQEQLIRQHEQILRAQAQISAFVSEFQAGRSGGRSDDAVVRVVPADAVLAEVSALVGEARRELLATRPAAAAGALMAELRPLDLSTLRVRVVAGRAADPLPDAQSGDEALRDAVAAGALVRLADEPPVELTVADRRVAVVRLGPLPAAGSASAVPADALAVRSPELVALGVALFEHLWAAAGGAQAAYGSQPAPAGLDGPPGPAEPAGRPGRTPRPRTGAHDAAAGEDGAQLPSPAELLLLRLLAEGVKDEAAARTLGLSVRTVRRMVAELMRQLDARSRFQAGILATQRGWL